MGRIRLLKVSVNFDENGEPLWFKSNFNTSVLGLEDRDNLKVEMDAIKGTSFDSVTQFSRDLTSILGAMTSKSGVFDPSKQTVKYSLSANLHKDKLTVKAYTGEFYIE